MNEIEEYLAIDIRSPSGLVWIKRPSQNVKAGDNAFTTLVGGYYRGIFRKQHIYAHRVVYRLHHGKWPEGEIDHIDGNPANNTPLNLRDVDRSVNMQNKHRSKGVSFRKGEGKFEAYICQPKTRKKIHLGYFKTEDKAREAYLSAKSKIHDGWIEP
ncbi:MAG: hypothetical protein [Bacteriophage sp.]|nr:MAG: hypothetical protein [Bacteriophage sp.]